VLSIESASDIDATIAQPEGPSIDISNVAEFKSALIRASETGSALIVDLSSVTLLDSSGLGALLSVMRAMRGRSAQFLIANPTEPVKQLFELVMMDRVFQIYPSVEEAKRALQMA